MAVEYEKADFRGASFRGTDLTGATFRECDLSQVRIVASEIVDLTVSGHSGAIANVVINDVDVTAYVMGELDKRHPERVQLRAMTTADDYRAMWDTVERLWADTVARAEKLPESAREERIDGEWSFVQTLRHLVFATDVWVSRMALGEEAPYHRLGLPPTDYPATGADELGIEPDARPSFEEVLQVRAERMALVRRTVDALTDADLEELRTAAPAPAWGVESLPVGTCLRVVMEEECEHHRYATRDLFLLEAR
jgi:uncharacterized damage-inducible protein DinB